MYRGRFAPSPSGPLHFGSLIAATASYLQAKNHQGEWLVRIEDVDKQRNVQGADQLILHTLEDFGFEWDGEITHQSQRGEFYEKAIDYLYSKDKIYACDCSRKTILAEGEKGTSGIVYSGRCVDRKLTRNSETALRLRVSESQLHFVDQVFGLQKQNLIQEVGDFHLLRRDQCYAYHLAVVVDDHLQGITEVVRGYDILDSTARQIYLQHQLEFATPDYLHTPIAIDEKGKKLSKQTFAKPLARNEKIHLLYLALEFLGQQPPTALDSASLNEIWDWAKQHWDSNKIPKQNKIIVQPS